MGAEAVLIIPPLLKVVGGPLLGPAMLAAAGRAGGHRVHVLDLNMRWLRDRLPEARPADRPDFVGDHDRPGQQLRLIEQDYLTELGAGAAGHPAAEVAQMRLSHGESVAAASRLAGTAFGRWTRECLRTVPAPQVVGISVMYAGQVIAALATSLIVRERWPSAIIVWGGAHVTALGAAIVADARYGEVVDRFVVGYAERTWRELLDAVATGATLPAEVLIAGAGPLVRAREDVDVVPAFDDLSLYAAGCPTIATQSSRGCAYGRCAFCTYPGIEGPSRLVSLEIVRAAVDLAERHRGLLSFKDSLVTVPRLAQLVDLIAGRVRWSACTKINAGLDAAFLRRLAAAGCATLEVGLETVVPQGQRLVRKVQDWSIFTQLLDAAAAAGVAIVVNYITGFPGVDAAEDERGLANVREALTARLPLVAKLEHNRFELERSSPMGLAPSKYGIIITRSWPWATVMAWESARAVQRPGSGRLVVVRG